jgi:hypothetical protein
VTEQSVALLRHLKAFFNLTFRIEQCQDDVYSDSDEEEQESGEASADNGEAPPQFP